jgi:diguanylate cyclase (GGDEF)-like protein/PAS domain S-box-containing protein
LLFDEHLRASGGTSTFIGRSLRGEGKQLMVMRTVSRDKLHIDAPIVLAVNRALFAVDGPWRLRAWELGGFYAFCLAASCVALRTRQNRRELLARAEASAASARAEGVRRLQLVADLLPSLVAYLDTDQRFLFANHAYREWLRVDPAALIGKSLAELFGDAAYQTFRMQIEAALAGERQVCEREMQTPGGSRYAEITAVPQLDPFGRVEGLCVLIHDLTERRRIELEQKRSEERLSLAIEGSNLGLFDWDLTSNEIFLSARAQEMLGGEAVPSKLTAARAQRLIHPEDIAAVRHMARGVVEGSASNFNAEYRVHHRSGSWLWVRSRGRVFERDAHGKALRLAGTHFEIGERKAREERLRQLAETDALTGLPNRALFQDRLRHALDRAVRSGRILALLFVDIDHFKQVNDMAGHAAGDQVLMAFSARLTEAVRKSDTVARLGGDEFTVILEELGQREDARVVAEKLVVSARLPIPLSDRVVHVSASVGIAFFQGAAESEHQLMGRADAALYEAKARGRNGWVAAGEHEGSPPG